MKTTVIVLAALLASSAAFAEEAKDVRETAAYEACLQKVSKEIQAEGGTVTNAIFGICDEEVAKKS